MGLRAIAISISRTGRVVLLGSGAALSCGGQADPSLVRSTQRLSQGDVAATAPCTPGPLNFSATPVLDRGPLTAQTTAVYDVVVTDGDVGACDPRILFSSTSTAPAGFTVFVTPTAALVEPGQQTDFVLSVTATTNAAPGLHAIPYGLTDATTGQLLTGSVPYDLSASPDCFVRPDRELFVTDVSVVDDSIRTTFVEGGPDARWGAFSFGRLAERLAPTAADAPAWVEKFFQTWLTDQSVNGFTVAARPSIQEFLLDPWPRLGDGSLDLARAPLRLLAIVNRIDTRGSVGGLAGQARFVFGVLDGQGGSAPFTLIAEYHLPATNGADVLSWAQAWHKLGSLPFPSETYNAALQSLTDRFTARGADRHAPNGSALATIRTDDFALADVWELRQFRLSAADGLLHPSPVDSTPDTRFIENSTTLADFVNERADDIVRGDDYLPLLFEGAPFRGGSSINFFEAWNAPGIVNPEARHLLSLNTCNGCHSGPETGTNFLHVSPRDPGASSPLSEFILGIAIPDPFTGQRRTFNELDRRKLDLERLVCGPRGTERAQISDYSGPP